MAHTQAEKQKPSESVCAPPSLQARWIGRRCVPGIFGPDRDTSLQAAGRGREQKLVPPSAFFPIDLRLLCRLLGETLGNRGVVVEDRLSLFLFLFRPLVRQPAGGVCLSLGNLSLRAQREVEACPIWTRAFLRVTAVFFSTCVLFASRVLFRERWLPLFPSRKALLHHPSFPLIVVVTRCARRYVPDLEAAGSIAAAFQRRRKAKKRTFAHILLEP